MVGNLATGLGVYSLVGLDSVGTDVANERAVPRPRFVVIAAVGRRAIVEKARDDPPQHPTPDEASPLLAFLMSELSPSSVSLVIRRPDVKMSESAPGPIRRGGKLILTVCTGILANPLDNIPTKIIDCAFPFAHLHLERILALFRLREWLLELIAYVAVPARDYTLIAGKGGSALLEDASVEGKEDLALL